MATAKKRTTKSSSSTQKTAKQDGSSNNGSSLPKGKILAATAGVAAAAAAAGVAYFRTSKGSANGRTVYHVLPASEGWQVKGQGAERASSVHGTKKEALTAGRDLAHGKVPSQLVVHKSDGTVQESWTYDAAE